MGSREERKREEVLDEGPRSQKAPWRAPFLIGPEMEEY